MNNKRNYDEINISINSNKTIHSISLSITTSHSREFFDINTSHLYQDSFAKFWQIESQIEMAVNDLVKNLSLNPVLLNVYLPLLVNDGLKKIRDFFSYNFICGGFENNILDTTEIVGTNIYIKMILDKMTLFANENPISLLVWTIVLCKFIKFILNKENVLKFEFLCGELENIAAKKVDNLSRPEEVYDHLSCLTSLLVHSTND